MIPLAPTWLRPVRRARPLLVAVAAVAVAACGTISRSAPAPTPADFPGIASWLGQHGIQVTRVVSGDAGCDDADLSRTAIGFDAAGLDQATPVRVHIYIFRNRATYERLRATVDHCAASYVTDPSTYESVETSPYVVAGNGPWGATFREDLRQAITAAAGTGD